MPDSAQPQLLHLVIGGELTDLGHTTFKDLSQVEIVGLFPNYATAYTAWKAKAQQTVDNAHMRYFIVHLHRAKVLISRHRDGEFNAVAAERLGIGTIRGSGDHGSAFHRKGGVGAFKEMVRALEDDYNIALTADVPKRSRVAGLGIIMLARESGRPIMPFAMATSRFVRLHNWDRTTINLPFGRGALVGGEIIIVPPDADAETMEDLRARLEATLNDATRRAYAQIGRPERVGH